MAIQLNDRDTLIFKLIEEHEVLLEKHIAWFIAQEGKPVLIRDRLRKLFYLDYLLCARHEDTLSWWTTPTKPLVYTLSSLAKQTIGSTESSVDLTNQQIQRHRLEIANLRMLFHIEKNKTNISDFTWTTCHTNGHTNASYQLDALVSFNRFGSKHTVGIINHPNDTTILERLKSIFSNYNLDSVWIISSDKDHQKCLQKIIAADPQTSKSCYFALHQSLYEEGLVNGSWENPHEATVDLLATIQ